MNLEILRRTFATVRKSLPTSISWVLVLSLFVGIPSQIALSSTANAAACSPTTSSVNGETLVVFSTIGNCTWTVPLDITNVELLVVGGGGSGSAGIANIYWPGGGGGGGVETRSGFAVTPGSTLSVTTGSGGGATASSSGVTGNNGTASSFGSITANGGLTPSNTATANAGAKGGTSGNGNLGATGTANGINCGASLCGTGGGGGSEAAGSGLNGGSGITSSITGTAVGYGGGGAGGNGASGTASDGGAVGYYASTSASATGNAAANTGGGGARNASGYGGAGGSGVVIVRYIAISAGSSALRFDSNGGSGSKDTQVLTTGSTATAPTISGFSKSGSFFTAWNTAADGSGTSYRPGATFTLTGNALLYAQWQATTFLGTTYSAPAYSFGGGSNSGVVDCAAGNVLVGAAFQQNPMVVANYCVPLLSDLTVAPLSSSVRATSNYVFCPDGMVAIGYKYISGVKLGLQCKTPPGLSDTVVETSFITASTTVSRGATAYSGSSMCNAGDVVVGFSRSWNLWLDSHGARCAPFAKYYISYNANGSVTTAPTTTTQSVPQEWLTVASYSGVRTGYHFSGWNTANTGLGTDYAVGLEIAPGGNTALFAKWTSTITYDSNSATSGTVPSPTVAVGTQAQTLLATNSGTLAKTGYTFTGWNTAANGSGTNYAAGLTTYSSPGDITLYAQWNSTITYNGNGQTSAVSTVPAATTAKGTAANTTLASQGSLVKSGSNFSGWNTSADGTGTNYAAGLTTFASPGNITLYAQWTTPTTAPTLDSGSDLGTSSTDKITSDNTPTINVGAVASGARVVITATSATGVTYTCTVESATVTSSCTFGSMADGTYSFTVQQTYNGATSAASTALAGVVIDATRPTVTLSSTVANGANDLIARNTAITNYTITATFSEAVSGFLIGEITKDAASSAWTLGSTLSGSGATYTFTATNSSVLVNVVGKLLLRVAAGVATDTAGNTNTATAADFVINSVARVDLWDCGPLGQFCTGGTGPASVTQASSGAAVTLPGPNTLYKTGHTFTGWSESQTGGSLLTGSYTPTTRIILFPQWTPNVYVVSFDANGGTGAPDSSTVNYTYGTTGLAASSTYNAGTLAKTGYTFAGWSATPGGAAVANPYVPTGSVTLYARWTAGTYAVTYDSNTATSGSLTNLSITAGTAATLSASTTPFSKPGYTFNGWNTLADGSGTSYAANASVTFYANTTLYAKWKIVAPAAPTVPAVSAGNTTVAVTVAAAAVSGTTSGATDSFTVQTYSDSGTVVTGKTCTVLASANPLTCTVSGLTNGTIYKFKTTAYNSTGSAISTAFSSTATPGPYTVIYNINGGTSGAISNGSYNLGTPLTLPTPSRTNYTFSGWYDTTTAGTLIGVGSASYSPVASVTIYARWVGVSYTITYYGNGATSGTVPAAGSFTAGGSAYPVSDNTGILARTGYTFGGWDTSTAGNGTAYAVNASYSANANLNLYAKWTPVARTVTYAGTKTSGDLPAQLTNKYIGETFTVSSASGFARTGFAFTGWSDGTNTYAAGATYTISSTDVTLTAQWAGVSYSITYLANGGSGTLPAQSNLSNGETFTVGANSLNKTGYSFVAWNDGSANYAPGATYTMTAANTSLIAQWTATGYTITFDGNGADGGSAPTTGRYVTGGAPYSVALNTYTKTGYNFTGWKTSAAVDYAPGAGYASTADLVLIAQWVPKTIAISYNINGGSGTAPASQNWTYNASTPATLDAGSGLTKTGYTLGGWASSASATSGSFTGTPSSSLTYYAVWTPVTYAIIYTAGTNGTGTVPTQTGKTLGSTFTLASGSGISRPDESGVSFSFAYWSDGGTTYASGATFLMPARDVTLVANWIAIYNVTYNANGGVTNNASVQKTESATVTIGDAPTRDGYTFGKWVAQSGEQFDPGASTTVQNNRYLFTATWTAIPRSVTYDLNGGSGSAPSTVTGKTIGQIVTLDSTTATKAGYSFGGWLIGGVTYPAGANYTIATADVTPVAVWSASTYAISYNGNGATSGTVPPSGTFTTGGSYTASSNTGILAKTGFTFAGWNTTANGDGTSYAEGATNVTTTADLILYAKWIAASFAVTYVANGATSALPTQSAVQFGNTFTVASAATQAGKTFTGWSDGTNTYGGGSTYTMGGSAVTLTATWANQLFAITYSLNGGTGASAPTQGALSSSDTFTVQSTSATKAGYSFGGWSNGTNTYQANASYNMTTTNVTLTAIWNVAVPGTPGTPTVSAGDGNATITVVAPSTRGAPTSYTVTASPGGATCTVISPATSCTITGLTNGTSYSFATVANNATGSSSASPSSAAVSPAGKPGVPTGVTATIGNGSANVSLTPPTNTGGPAITSYTMTASPGGASCTVNAPSTSCSISPLENGTAYTFTSTAFNGVARSDSSTASASVTPATVPDAPTITSATSSSSGTTTVNFSAPASTGGSAITGYTITSDPGGFTCTAAANATSCAVTGLTDGVAYTFAAVATNAIGNSSSSGASSAVTSAGTASAPTSVTGTVGDGSSTISVSGANANGSAITGYTVQAYDSTGLAISGKTCSITSPAASCQITGLTNGSEYTFTAKATNGVGTSAASAPSATVTPAGVPSAPTGVTATSGTGKVTVAWTAPAANGAAITSYTVQAYNDSGTAVSGAICTISAPSTSCDVTSNLIAGSNYTFKVVATNAAGTGSASTASAAAAINAAPSAPRNVTATGSNGSATVSWDAPSDSRGSAVTGYTVTAYTAGNIAAGTCTATAPTETCSVTGLTNGELYTFKVTATNGIGTSAQSTASAAVKPSTIPSAPTSVVASAGDASASISFTAPATDGGSSITGYVVTASDGTTASGTSSPIRITGLANESAYTFTVKATNANGDSVASSASASATPKANFAPVQTSDAQPSGLPYVGTALTSQVTFSGAPTPTLSYQWKVCDDPAEVTTCSNISGATAASFTPTISEEGKYIVVATTATNSIGSNTVTSQPTLVINPEIIYSTPNSGLSGTANASFVLTVAAAGGVSPYTYSISSGALPTGLSLDPTTGQLAGTPSTSGTFTFGVRATDANSAFKVVNVTLTIASASQASSGGSTGGSSVSPSPAATPTVSCDATCQAAKDARAAADKAAADATAKAKADATAKAAADKAAADAAAKAQNSAQAKAAADAAAAVQAAADAAAKAAAATAAKAEADKAAAAAAAAVKAAQAAASATKPGTSSTTATAAATKAATEAAAAVKAAAAAAATAAAAKKQVDISLNLSVTAATKAADSAAAQKQANAVAAAAKAAAEAAAAQAIADANAARAKAAEAATAAANAQAAAVAEKKAATQAAIDAQIAAKSAAAAAAAKVAADQAAQKAAIDLAKALADKAAQSAKVAEIADPTAKAAAQTALAEVTKKVEELTVVATTTSQQFEAKAKEVEAILASANQAVEIAKQKTDDANAAAQIAATKVSAATQAAKVATTTTAAATAASAVAKSLPTTVKIAPAPKPNTSIKDGNGTKATITGLKPGQKIKVTVKEK